MILRLLPLLLLPVSLPLIAQEAPPVRTGETIYRDMCASCHGPKGEGVADKHDEPLYGERSVHALAKLIDKTMPEDKEDTLDAEGSALVAEYIYNAFYSPVARARNHPPRIDLVHLTNRQYRESVADVIGSFLAPPALAPADGLKGEYFESEGMNKKAKHKLERVDRALDFDFGEGPPIEGCSAEQFSIAWQGTLLARDTGEYEFRLRTPNGARFYLNRDFREGDKNFRDDSDVRRQPALIDGWVSSGAEVRELTAKTTLLGGRRYPVRLDFFKYKDKRGSVKLEWKPPHGVWQVLSAPHLSPGHAGRVSVISTPFPPDDSSLGYERGSAVSKDWHDATTRAAIEAAGEIVERLRLLSGAKDDAPDYAAKLKDFCATLAARAFRRPLSAEDRAVFVDRHFAEGVPPETAVKRSVLLMLKSPRFLYPDTAAKDDHTVATRLALYLWDSVPDETLRTAAEKGELRTPEQVRAQADRMMQDPRARAKLREFFHTWLSFEEADDLSKDEKAFPGFDDQMAADLRTSLELFIDDVVWREASDYRQLLLSDTLYLNPRLAAFYGAPAPQAVDFQPVKMDAAQRAGVFTHPYLLAALSYHKSSSPIHRGVFMTRNIMGRFLKPPPMAISFMDDKFDPSLTMREKVTELTKNANCMACHAVINPLGFSLENFDATGRWRTADNNKPVNSAAEYATVDGEVVQLKSPRDVATHAAGSRDSQSGFVRQMFHHLVKYTPAAYGADTQEKLHASFTASGFHIRKLAAEIAALAALR